MKNYIIILIAILFSFNLDAQWTNINSLNNVSWQELDFPSNNIAYGISSSDKFYKTTDEGSSWQELILNFPNLTNPDFLSIDFVNDSTGYLFLRAYVNQQLESHLFKTTDGGLSWMDVSPNNLALGYGIAKVYFVNTQKGFVGTGDRLYRTVDGGQNWTERIFPNYVGVMDIDFFDENHGILGAWDGTFLYAGSIYTTNDGGMSWDSLVFSTAYSSVEQVDFVSSTVAYALEQGAWNGTQKLYKTEDAGVSWDSIALNSLTDSADRAEVIYFLDENEGYILSTQNKIYHTTDAGLSWIEEYATSTAGLSTITQNNSKLFVGGGPDLLLTKDLITSIASLPSKAANQLFPNPVAKGEAVYLKQAVKGDVQIYNLSGQLVSYQFLNGQESISTKGLDAGLYLIKVRGQETNCYKLLVE